MKTLSDIHAELQMHIQQLEVWRDKILLDC